MVLRRKTQIAVSLRDETIGEIAKHYGILTSNTLKIALENVDNAAARLYHGNTYNEESDMKHIKNAMLYFKIVGGGIIRTNPNHEELIETLLEWCNRCDNVLKNPSRQNLAKILNLGSDIKELKRS